MNTFSTLALRYGVPIGMIIVGTLICATYTRDLAKQHKEFSDRLGIGRDISEDFHLFLARFMGGIAIAGGLALLGCQFFLL